jgi:hypothetical protein
MKGTKSTMKVKTTWSHIAETAACQVRNGWLLIPITVGLTVLIVRIGLLASCLVVLVLTGVLWVRKYRITIQRKNDE